MMTLSFTVRLVSYALIVSKKDFKSDKPPVNENGTPLYFTTGVPFRLFIGEIEFRFPFLFEDAKHSHKNILIFNRDNKEYFTHDELGIEDYSKFDLASSMLSYIAATSIGVNDGINYVDEIIDPELCRETFQMIFHHMNQEIGRAS